MRSKRVLVAPLDWGLGHASRCATVIQGLLKKNYDVLLASSGQALVWLQSEFPDLKTYELPAYHPVYPKGSNMVLKMAMQLPKFIGAIKAEHTATQKIIADAGIDVVIADNRYGCHSKQAKSILMTHQVNVLMPDAWKFAQHLLNRFNHEQIKKFDACWVPAPSAQFFPALMQVDFPITYIGFLSRLKTETLSRKYDVVVICTGPEPQRSIFEAMVLDALKQTELCCLVVRSKMNAPKETAHKHGRITIVNYLNSDEMSQAINQSDMVISRSGYSTVMDLMKLNKRSIMVPTPGQTEQEYIGQMLSQKKLACCVAQKDFNFQRAKRETEQLNGFENYFDNDTLLQNALDTL